MASLGRYIMSFHVFRILSPNKRVAIEHVSDRRLICRVSFAWELLAIIIIGTEAFMVITTPVCIDNIWILK